VITEQQVVDIFASLMPGSEMQLPMDPVMCLWLYYTQEELEEQVANLIDHEIDKFRNMDEMIRSRRFALVGI
jgi:hypothetical protein